MALDQPQIQKHLPPDLPPVHADKRRFRQVLVNLLSNAVKFTPSDGQVTIAACWERATGMTITVQDTGIGIAEENLGRILEPFRQIEDPLSRKHEGAGLGLPLARALIELHGCDMRIESKQSSGTTVALVLPPKLILEATPAAPNIRVVSG